MRICPSVPFVSSEVEKHDRGATFLDFARNERGWTEAGFTLVELMVALFIFAILSAAGVMLLSGSIGAQGAVQQRLDGLADVQRAASLLTVDLAQATRASHWITA